MNRSLFVPVEPSIFVVLAAALFVVLQTACATGRGPNARPVDEVDLERFAGLWYEVASIDTPPADAPPAPRVSGVSNEEADDAPPGARGEVEREARRRARLRRDEFLREELHRELRKLEAMAHERARAEAGIDAEATCVGTTIDYRLRKDGDLHVIRRCDSAAFGGQPRRSEGRAFVYDEKSRAHLRIDVFWPQLRGDYWIIELDDDYQYSVVAAPAQNRLWILSRTPCIDPTTYQALVARLERRGFDTSQLATIAQRDATGEPCPLPDSSHRMATTTPDDTKK